MRDTHDQLIRLFVEYFNSYVDFTNKPTKNKNIASRRILSDIIKTSRVLRTEFMEKQKVRRASAVKEYQETGIVRKKSRKILKGTLDE